MPRLTATMLLALMTGAAPASAQKLLPAAGSLVAHDANGVFLRVSNRGGFGLSLEAGDVGNFPRGTANRYLFGSGLWIGGIGDVDANGVPDSIVTVGYNPENPAEIEWVEGAVGDSTATIRASASSTAPTRRTRTSSRPSRSPTRSSSPSMTTGYR